MKKLFTFAMMFFAGQTAYGAQVKEVCEQIRHQDDLHSTQRIADDCDRKSAANFDASAVEVCLTIARGDALTSTQRLAVECVDTIANKTIPSRVAADCLRIAREDSFGSTQRKAVACLKKDATDSNLPAPAPEGNASASEALSQWAIVRGSGVTAQVTTIKVIGDNGGEFYWILLNNVTLKQSEMQTLVGDVCIVPPAQTKMAAEYLAQEIDQAIQSGQLSVGPINKVRLYLAKKDGAESTFAQSELTRNPADRNLLKIGAIELSSLSPGKNKVERWGLSVPEEVVRSR